MNKLAVELGDCRKFGVGVQRPEDVTVGRDGTVWISDQKSACARVLPDGSFTRVGLAGGAPNGINLDLEGRIVIANFGGPEDGVGPLQRLDPVSGQVTTLCDSLGGRKLFGANYPLVDGRGRVWCSHSTYGPLDAAWAGQHDGAIFRVDGAQVEVLAEGIEFANGIAFDADDRYLYVCQTTACNVIRFPINADGSLGKPSPYGPTLGYTNAEVQHLRPLTLDQRSQLGPTDGCGFDVEGNLWVTLVLANKIVAITPNQEVVTVVCDPAGTLLRKPTNVSWGGKDMRDLYIGSVTSDYVLKVRSPIPGMRMWHQR